MSKAFHRFADQAAQVKKAMNLLKQARLACLRAGIVHDKRKYSTADAEGQNRPAYMRADAEGFIDGCDFTPRQYKKAMELFVDLELFLTGQEVAPTDHSDTIEAIADA